MKTRKLCFALSMIFLLFVAIPGQARQMVSQPAQSNLILKSATVAPLQKSPAALLAEKLKSFSFSSLKGENSEFCYIFRDQVLYVGYVGRTTQFYAIVYRYVIGAVRKVPP